MTKAANSPAKKDDNIYLVEEESVLEDPKLRENFGMQLFPNFIKHKRVIPFPAKASYGVYHGKVKGKDLIRLYFEIDTGLVLMYQGKKWKDEHSIEIDVPLKDARMLAKSILKTLERIERKSP